MINYFPQALSGLVLLYAAIDNSLSPANAAVLIALLAHSYLFRQVSAVRPAVSNERLEVIEKQLRDINVARAFKK